MVYLIECEDERIVRKLLVVTEGQNVDITTS